ncbi:hypothetical protein BDW62DRAFT_197321 [Aspergillus aurantiobrunneus]
MSDQRALPRNRRKSRTGCPRCKQRRIKCDETIPHCSQCTRRGFDCPGYKRPLKWSSKYEIGFNRRSEADSATPRRPALDRTVDTLPPVTPLSIPWESGTFTDSDGREVEGPYTATDNGSSPDANPAARENLNNNLPHVEQNLVASSTPLNTQIPIEQVSFDLDNTAEWMQLAHISLPLSLPLPLEDPETGISRHYFVQVCRVNSCFDSDTNFFRVEVGNLMASSPLIYHCVLSMSAAHLAGLGCNMEKTALDHRTRALSCLKSEIGRLKDGNGDNSNTPDRPSEALLGSILLGMTDGWHNPSFLGTTHLHGARVLFKQWICSIRGNPSASLSSDSSFRLRSFMIGVMAYWEAVASFLINQSVDATAYLDSLGEQNVPRKLHPNPWAGICTPLFVYLARAGTLARQRSLLKHLSIVTSSANTRSQLIADILQAARATETALLHYQIPSRELIEDTEDPLTPVIHLQRLAQIYRLAALLELYRNFPELFDGGSDQADEMSGTEIDGLAPAARMHSMAVSILTLVAAIPQISGVNCLLTLPLIIAGSTLQPTHPRPPRRTQSTSYWNTLSAEIISISSSLDVQLYWRDFVRSRLEAVLRYVGLSAISRATQILEKVWTRSDTQSVASCLDSGAEAEFVQWIEVMVEEKLETVFG